MLHKSRTSVGSLPGGGGGVGVSRGLAQLWVVRKIDFSALTNNQSPGWMVKFMLVKRGFHNPSRKLKKRGNLGKEWEPASIGNVVIFSIRPDKLEELIALMDANDTKDLIENIQGGNTFSFTYDVLEASTIKSDYLDPGHDVEDFRAGSTVAVEFQIRS